MQGTITQALGLVIAANARHAGWTDGAFWPDSSIFTFCRSARFVDPRPGGLLRRRDREIAADPDAWLQHVEKARAIRIHAVSGASADASDRMLVGFVGGGPRWLIEVERRAGSELWEGTWQVTDADASDRRIWSVTYLRLDDRAHPPSPNARGVGAVCRDLRDILARAISFSHRHAPHFAPSFERAGQLLDDPAPLSCCYHADLDPGGVLPLEARQLLAATMTAWVFGGMGSWNDQGFEPPADVEYDQISEQLFATLVEGAVASTNAAAHRDDDAGGLR